MKRFRLYKRIKIRKRKRKQRAIRKQKGGFIDFGYLVNKLTAKRPPPSKWLYKALEQYV